MVVPLLTRARARVCVGSFCDISYVYSLSPSRFRGLKSLVFSRRSVDGSIFQGSNAAGGGGGDDGGGGGAITRNVMSVSALLPLQNNHKEAVATTTTAPTVRKNNSVALRVRFETGHCWWIRRNKNELSCSQEASTSSKCQTVKPHKLNHKSNNTAAPARCRTTHVVSRATLSVPPGRSINQADVFLMRVVNRGLEIRFPVCSRGRTLSHGSRVDSSRPCYDAYCCIQLCKKNCRCRIN